MPSCYLGVRVGVAAHLLEEVPAQPRDDALVVGLAHHRVGLPRPRLAVRKDAHVVPCDQNYIRLPTGQGYYRVARVVVEKILLNIYYTSIRMLGH